ncbi:MAG: Hsp20/alpha crystallin family protein [Solirubrobacteraceae bacterium]
MSTDRDLFANFERMRREMDELFGDVFGAGGGRGLHSRGAFTPAVDVYYVADPPRAIVRAELAGVRAAEIELEIRGRELILAGQRHSAGREDEERVYQQLEIQHGPFRRVISLGADVDADAAKASFEDGVLTVELPIRAPEGARQVPISRADEHEDAP